MVLITPIPWYRGPHGCQPHLISFDPMNYRGRSWRIHSLKGTVPQVHQVILIDAEMATAAATGRRHVSQQVRSFVMQHS